MKKPAGIILAAVLVMTLACGASAEPGPKSDLKQLFSFVNDPFDAPVWEELSETVSGETGPTLHYATFRFNPDSKPDVNLGFIGSKIKYPTARDPKEALSAEKDDESGYDYLLYMPENKTDKKLPLIISLHGMLDKNENNPWNLANDGLPKYILTRESFPIVMVAPLCREGSHWVEDKQGNEDMHEIDRLKVFVPNMIKKYDIDPKRVYVTGFSMGGRAAWKLACAMPETFAAVVPICGRADAYDLAKLSDVPVWLFHGARDEIVPLHYEINTIKRFIEMKHPDFRATILPENWHDAWTDAYRMPDLWEFITTSVRK